MCFVFTCGEHTFRKEVEGYNDTYQCLNCGNRAGHVVKTHPWFTFCFIPVIPLSFKGYEDVTCSICSRSQPLEDRPDIQAMRGGGGHGGHGVPLQHHGPPPPGGGGPPQPGWGQSPPPQGYGQSPPPQGWGQSPPPGNQPMRHG